MRKIALGLICITGFVLADISALDDIELEEQAEKIRKELNISSPTKQDKALERIRAELNLDFDTSSKDALLGNHKVSSVQPLVGVTKEESMSDSISSAFSNIKESLNIEPKKEDYSFSNSLDGFYDSVGMEEGDSFGMPSVFGFNEKPKKSSIEIPLLGGLQSTSTSIYKGMKHSGQSAELMSGMMYNSSKVYNTMFGLFDDSPFNVFDGDEKEVSIFDVFD